MRRVTAAALASTVLALTLAPVTAQAAPSRDHVTRAEYASINRGDTIARVQAKVGRAPSRITRTTPSTVYVAPGDGGDPVIVAVGATQTRAYRTGPKRYFNGPCWDVQVTYVQQVPGGRYVVARKERWSNVCYKPPAR